jgi:alkanesulfonate monooxygenase SsuD/methylene tetrahydromethanopterin reductase-like flavin-dependent oxidoreductase (luciferase family)
MDFSLYLNPQTPGPEHDARIIDETIAQAQRADRAGFRSICLTEHHFNGYNTFGDPFMFGAHLSGRLNNAWIVLTVATLPLHHPIRFAEQVNLLDQLHDGRVVVGIGAGGSPIESEGLGADLDERYAMLADNLAIARSAWQLRPESSPLRWKTPHAEGTVHGRIMPAPHTPTGPLLARACLSDESTEFAGREGLVLLMGRFGPQRAAQQLELYRKALVEAGYDESHRQRCLDWTGLAKMIFVGESDEDAVRQVTPFLDDYIAAANRSRSADTAEAKISKNGAVPGAHERDDYLNRAIILGGPDRVAAQLVEYAEVGLGHLMLWFAWGFMDAETVDRSMTLFIDQVLPRYHAAVADRQTSITA